MYGMERITINPAQMGGRPCIRGIRITVGMIVGQLGAGATIEQLLHAFPDLEHEDVMQALRYASWLASGSELDDEEEEGEWHEIGAGHEHARSLA